MDCLFCHNRSILNCFTRCKSYIG